MVRLAESDARAAAGDGAGVDRVEAAEERRRPLAVALWSGDAGGVFGGGRGAGHPAVNVLLHL